MKHADFVHLHVHSQYSLLDGMLKIEDLVRKAAEMRMPAVAVTDHGSMFGAIHFYEAALKEGVKPIIGCEMYVAPRSRLDKSPGENGDSMSHLLLLAENLKGYQNLCKLVTAGHLEGFYRKPRIDKELIEKHHEGLIAMTACIKGQIPALLLAGRDADAGEVADFYKELFGNRFFMELQINGLEEQKRANIKMLELARRMDIPIVATNDCHYPERDDAYAHEVLLCIQTGKTINDPSRMQFGSNEFYFKSPAEMKELFVELPEAIANSTAIAERCNLDLDLKNFHFPRFEVPEGETLDGHLEANARDGFKRRMEQIRKKRPDMTGEEEEAYRSRLDFELSIIRQMGFSGYFLIVSDFIKWARDHGISVGPGRGSAVGSLLSYSIGITDLDPLAYGLLFERFLNPDRRTMPDIDVDFCMERREEVLRYIAEKYGGAEYVAQIITFGTMKAKAVIRDVGRALDMSYADVDKVAKLVPNVLKMTLEKAFQMEPRFAEMRAADRRVDELLNLAVRIEGLTRHASTHAAGVVISDRPIVDYMPLYKGAHDEIVTQYDMNCVERIGLIKFDFLGLRTLTVIRHACDLIKATSGQIVDIDNLSFNDARVWELFGKGETAGVFQFESAGMRDLLVKMKPTLIEDLIAAVALFRPGPMQFLDEFIQRKLGTIPIKYAHPALEPILKETYGVMVYQEQVMQIAQALASFSKGEADVLRKAMGKKKVDVIAGQREKFVNGAGDLKVNKDIASDIFDQMAKFGEYGFNKSHAAAYAYVAFQTAYLKAHFPTEFMAALLSSEMDNTDNVVKYINECRDMKIEVKPPDVNESAVEFTVEGGAIRFGLKAVKNVGQAAIEAIIEARIEGGRFADLFEFASRVDLRRVNKKVIESLIKSGAFDSTGHPRGGMLDVLDSCIAEGQQAHKDRQIGQESLFGTFEESSPKNTTRIPKTKLPENLLLQYEKESLGFFITGHPLARFEAQMKKFANLTTDQASFKQEGAEVRVAGIVSAMRETRNKRNELMAFVTLEDLHGFIEVIVWADQYKQVSQWLKSDQPLLIIGKLESRAEKPKILADRVILLQDAPNLLCSRIHLHIQTAGLTRNHLVELKELLRKYPGQCPVSIHMVVPGRSETVVSLPESYKIRPGEELTKAIETLLGKSVTILEAA